MNPHRFAMRIVTTLSALLIAVQLPVAAQETPVVATVNYALSYLSDRLGEDDVEVVFPVPEGVDPSFWRPGIADVSTMQNAELIILNGAGFAGWTTKASLPRARIVNTARDFEDRFISTETVTHSHGADGEHSHTGTASYTWLDQQQAILQARAIASAFERRGLVDPEQIAARLAELETDLGELDAAAERLRPVAKEIVLIATHPRYQYLARAYGLDIRFLEWQAGAAPDAEQLAELVALRDKTAATILLWESRPPDEARTAVRNLGLTDVVFPTLATAPESSDYIRSFRSSIDDLAVALQSARR